MNIVAGLASKKIATYSVVTVAILSLLFYLSEYHVKGRDIVPNIQMDSDDDRKFSDISQAIVTNAPIHTEDDRNFYVNKYNLRNGTLELKGHYKGEGFKWNNNDTTVHIEGLSNLLNQIKPHILSDSKLEIAELPDEMYFKVPRKVNDASCKALIHNDESDIKRATELAANNTRKEVPPKEYTEMASNCSKFIRSRGYIMSSLTKEEEEFPIAFSILMFKAVEQCERLIRAIYRPQNLYCIHVDANSESDIFNSMSSIANCFDNVFVTPKRFKVGWGQMSQLEPELLCMEELLSRGKTWKYLINLTGQEFPLRTNYELVRILKEYNGANDVESTIERANKDRWEKAGPPPHDIVAVKGAVHIVVSRGYVDYALHDPRARDLLNWTRNVAHPDEAFFATLNHNPHLSVPGSYKGLPETDNKIKPFVARFKNWGSWPCHGQSVRGICIFGTGDLPLLATRKEMFANKFYLDYQHFAFECMEEIHFNNTRDEYMGRLAFDSRWYSKLGFVRNKVL